MSVAAQISRIQTARDGIRAKFVELGLARSGDSLTALASAAEAVENRGAVSATVKEGDTYTIPKGYHNGAGTVSGVGGGGSYVLQSKVVTPSKAQQSVTPDDGYYGLSDVTVGAIPENYQDVGGVTAGAGDVLTGKVFVDALGRTVAGAMPNNGEISLVIDGLTVTSAAIPAGYVSGGTVSLGGEIEAVLAAI